MRKSRWRRVMDWLRWTWLGQSWRGFKDWAWRRGSTVRPRWLSNSYHDPDGLLVYCMFELLGRFLEDPSEAAIVDWESDDEHRKAKAEMDEIWRWWNEVYLKSDPWGEIPAEIRPRIEYVPHPTIKDASRVQMIWDSPEAQARYRDWVREQSDAEAAREDELNRMLKRIIDVRRYMWS